MEQTNTPREIDKPEEKTTSESFWELVRFVLIALVVVVPIRVFIVEPFIVFGSSMVPTFQDKDYLLIDKISYELGNIKRGDVVVFRYPGDPSKFYIKRVIGLPDETVEIKGSEVTITDKNGKALKLDEPFVKNPADNSTHLELKSDEYFVMGDNRIASSDSRRWGAVKKDFFLGRAFLRLWPIDEIDLWPGNYGEENK